MQLDEVLRAAVAAQDVPFAVGMVGDAQGTRWAGGAGEAAPGRPAAPDTVFRIFSMTKAVGSLAAMILIERGKLAFDTPVTDVLPEFADLPVLEGFDGDTPRLRPQKTTATVAHLATHTSGLEYEFWNADVAKYLSVTGRPSILAGTRDAMNYPLTSDPGTRWGYGPGIDWLGLMVQTVDGRRIDAFCADEIFGPLGMASTAFEVGETMAPRLAEVRARTEDGTLVPFDLAPPPSPEVYGMGHALYSTPEDYLRFLRAILGGGALDGARVLSEESCAAMCRDHMNGLRFTPMATAVPPVSADFDPFPGQRKTHAFAFLRVEDDVPGMRSAGSLSWAGVLNTHYWIDPAKGLASVIMTQTLPFVEPRFMALYESWERAVYAGA